MSQIYIYVCDKKKKEICTMQFFKYMLMSAKIYYKNKVKIILNNNVCLNFKTNCHYINIIIYELFFFIFLDRT